MNVQPWVLAGALLLQAGAGPMALASESDGEEAAEEAAEAHAPTLNVNTTAFEVDGIRVIHKVTPGNMIVHASLRFDGGATTWSAANAGLLELALTVATESGPADMTRSSFSAALDSRGSSLSASPDYDMVTVAMGSIVPAFEETWLLMTRTLRDPAWRAADIELSRERQLTSIRTAMDDPDTALGRVARQQFFEGHPYGVPPEGYEETVEAFDAEAMQGALDELLVRSRMTVVVVGNVDRALVERLVHETLGSLPMGTATDTTTAAVVRESPGLYVDARPELPTNYVLGYFSAPAPTDADYAALQIALEILSDRLFEEVRTRRNLSYAVAAGMAGRRSNTGYLYVTAVDANTTLQVMYDTIDGMIDTPVDAQDLADQIEGYLTRYYMGLQSNSSQNGTLAAWELVAGDRMGADAHIDHLRSVTPDDVTRVLSTWVRNLSFVVIGDPADVDEALFTSR